MASEYASYIRRSAAEQEDKHRRESINRWLQDQNLSLSDIDVYAEQASGASAERDKFQELISRIEAGEWSYRRAAQNTPNVTRQTLSNIHDERLEWYLGDPESIKDERVAAAVAPVEQ